MYSGQTIEAMPTPTPPIQRKKINDVVDHASPQPAEHARSKTEATTSTFLRPNRSLLVPASKQPNMAPTIAELTNHPSIRVDNWKCWTIRSLAPEMTNKS